MSSKPLTDDERKVLWEQYVETYVHSQETFDTSVRTLAAAGVGVTVGLATAVNALGWSGGAAVILFLVSLGINLVSYATAQKDMRLRLDAVADYDREGANGNRWTKATHTCNWIAGITLLGGGVILALFIRSEV
jgi:hypothetical protein